MAKKFISNRLGRFTQLGKSLTKAGGHLALDKLGDTIAKAGEKGQEIQNWHRKAQAAREIIKSMGELKGALMKLGQMISITEDIFLPPEITKLFNELQKNAPSMKREDIESVFVESFGGPPESLFETFDWEPMAAASIGQVHKATIKGGQVVAVKIQYPQIVEAIENDFQNIDQLKKLITLLFPQSPNVDSYLKELRRSLQEECDYRVERESIDFFRKSVKKKFPNITIPQTFEEYSSKTVLTMEYLEGHDFVDSKKFDQENKDQLGQLLYDFHNFCFYELRQIHSDPQYGNYLFTENKIVVLDFGSVRSFSEEFVKDYILLLKSIENKDIDLYREVLLRFGFFTEDDSKELFANHLDMVYELYAPFANEGKYPVPNRNPMELIKGFVDTIELKGRKSPREEFLLLDRAHLGLYTKIKGWGCEIDWVSSKHSGWRKYDV